jgi:hypothetical protein
MMRGEEEEGETQESAHILSGMEPLERSSGDSLKIFSQSSDRVFLLADGPLKTMYFLSMALSLNGGRGGGGKEGAKYEGVGK